MKSNWPSLECMRVRVLMIRQDWEPTTDPAPGDAKDYASFLNTFSDAMHEHNLKVHLLRDLLLVDPPSRSLPLPPLPESNGPILTGAQVSVDAATWNPIWNFTLLAQTSLDVVITMVWRCSSTFQSDRALCMQLARVGCVAAFRNVRITL